MMMNDECSINMQHSQKMFFEWNSHLPNSLKITSLDGKSVAPSSQQFFASFNKSCPINEWELRHELWTQAGQSAFQVQHH
jgi:hypothetical protein